MILKISLKPLGNFFFGGENGFQEAGDDRENRRTTYRLHSRNYPQQTGVLGMLRNQLLLQNGLLKNNAETVNNRAAAAALIGKHNFRQGYTGSYGVIDSLSPVYVASANGNIWVPGPRDDVKMTHDSKSWTMTLQQKRRQVWLEGYTDKSACYAHLQYGDKSFSEKNIFQEVSQVGITKSARPWGNVVSDKDEERNYYYQTFKRFSAKVKHLEKPEGYCFYLRLKHQASRGKYSWSWSDTAGDSDGNERTFTLSSGIVEMGGERSVFQMTVEKLPEETAFPEVHAAYQNTRRPSQLRSLVCLSPAMVDTVQLRKLSKLTVSESLSFRFLKSTMEAKDTSDRTSPDGQYTSYYQSVWREEDAVPPATVQTAMVESSLFHLLDRGSVIHFEPGGETDPNSTINQLKTLFHQQDFINIGYNKYCII